MNIAVLGTGYVGLVAGVGFADMGQTVTCVDVDREKIRMLEEGKIPIFEPGLEELVRRNVHQGRLRFSTDVPEAVRHALAVFLAVGTDATAEGFPDLTQIWMAADMVADSLNDYKVVAIKSTVPVGTAAKTQQRIAQRAGRRVAFDVVSNPEFLREGAAVTDFFHPNRIVVGSPSERATEIMRELYRPLYLIQTPLVITTWETAELTKYAANAFLALKVSYVNELANLCDAIGPAVDVHEVVHALGLDPRIGSKFLHPGPGFGGYCFPKDTRALVAIAKNFGEEYQTVEAAIAINDRQYCHILRKLKQGLGTFRGKVVAVLGLSFKPNTDDVRESRALLVAKSLLSEGSELRVFDPAAMNQARRVLGEQGVTYCSDSYDAIAGADATVICTEWNEFRNLDLSIMKQAMRGKLVVDSRNILDLEKAKAVGLDYFGTGRR